MKRFYQTAAISGLILAATSLGIGATAAVSKWQAIRPGSEDTEAKAPAPRKLSPGQRNLLRLGVAPEGSQLEPVGDPVQNITVRQRPANIARTKENPKARLFGFVSRHGTMTVPSDAMMVSIDPVRQNITSAAIGESFFQSIVDSYAYQGSAYKDGIAYLAKEIQSYDGWAYIIDEVDITTGKVIDTHNFGGNTWGDPYTMVWDPSRQVFVGLAMNSDSHSHLVTIDPKTWTIKYITHLGSSNDQFFAAITYNPTDGKLYAFDTDNYVYDINPEATQENQICVNAGEIDGEYELFEPSSSGLITWSPRDQVFLSLARQRQGDSSFGYYLCTLDPNGWVMQEVCPLSAANLYFISSIICTDEAAEAEAPEKPANLNCKFTGNSLTGDITVVAPSYTYYGIEIPSSKKINMVVRDGDKVIINQSLAPGQTYTANVTLEEGLHTLTTTASFSDALVSPANVQKQYVGNDTPLAPRRIVLSGNELTWREPVGEGVNKGYVDPSKFEYNVYVDGVKVNDAPIKTRSYTLKEEGEQKDRVFGITTLYAGYESEPGTINAVFGKALELPFSVIPTQDDSKLFTVHNSNDDTAYWMWTHSQLDPNVQGMVIPMSQFNDCDDWLVLPRLHFDDASKLYEFSFDASKVLKYNSVESFEIYLGRGINVSDMDELLYSIDDFNVYEEPTKVAVRFAVPEAGDYHLAIYCRSNKANEAKGIFTNNFLVRALDGKTSAVPANSADAEVVPAPYGELKASIKMTLPTLDLIGNPLNANDEITANVECGRFTSSGKGKPGEVISVDIEVQDIGFNTFYLTLENKNGLGMRSSLRRYIGIDTPLPPTNINSVTAEDNRTMMMSWDAPSNVGVNGGYVDVDNILYELYLRTSGIGYSRFGSTRDTKFVFDPDNETLRSYTVGPAAVSEGGRSQNSLFRRDVLGVPYETPMHEEFNSTKYDYSPYSFDTANEYSGSYWQNSREAYSYGVGVTEANPPVQGVIVGFSETGVPCSARVRFPKATTKDVKVNTRFNLRYWDYLLCPNLTVYGRRANHQEIEPLHTFTSKHLLKGDWTDVSFELPKEYLGEGWVEFYVGGKLSGNEYVIIDSWGLSHDVDYDLKASAISAPAQATVGETHTFTVSVANTGQERNTGKLIVELISAASGTTVQREEIALGQLNPNQVTERKVTFELTGDLTANNSTVFFVKATVVSDKDEVENNNSRQISVTLRPSQIPTVANLKFEDADNTPAGEANLSWRVPTMKYGTFDDFELHEPFKATSQIGRFQNIDLDKHYPTDIGTGDLILEWEGSHNAGAWTVIDPSKTVFGTDPSFSTRSGKQMLMARAPYTAEGTPEDQINQANDWLISPEVKGGSKISFWYNKVATDYDEFIELWVSFDGTKLDPENATKTSNGDFYKMRSFSHIGQAGWGIAEETLPADAKYFALVYRSFDSLGAFVDDLTYEPVSTESWTLVSYDLYRMIGDDVQIVNGATPTDRTFHDTNLPSDKPVYYWLRMKVQDKDGKVYEGAKSNIIVLNAESGVDEVFGISGIAGGRGEIIAIGHEGKTFDVFALDGHLTGTLRCLDNNTRMAVEPGFYIVTDGKKASKIIVK